MKAIILAAGRGSRMENLTEEKPKCLVELKGQTLLDMQINALQAAGITEEGPRAGSSAPLRWRDGCSRPPRVQDSRARCARPS